jgi:hypothetical protein
MKMESGTSVRTDANFPLTYLPKNNKKTASKNPKQIKNSMENIYVYKYNRIFRSQS